jgi:hypothetical protein
MRGCISPAARGQFVPFGVASVITAGSFAVVYLTAYCIAQRQPQRLKRCSATPSRRAIQTTTSSERFAPTR